MKSRWLHPIEEWFARRGPVATIGLMTLLCLYAVFGFYLQVWPDNSVDPGGGFRFGPSDLNRLPVFVVAAMLGILALRGFLRSFRGVDRDDILLLKYLVTSLYAFGVSPLLCWAVRLLGGL